ncbi:MAG: hypothetical protein WC404_00185 [Candidatus Omnitrophota bacterium]|jgi:hypothetical protein
MNIRPALSADLPEIYTLYENYKHPSIAFDKAKVSPALDALVEKGCVIVCEENGKIIGGAAGFIFPCMFTNDKIFQAMFLYFKEGYRHLTGKFLSGLEIILDGKGVDKIIFASLNEKTGRFYRMNGYEPIEVNYSKDI